MDETLEKIRTARQSIWTEEPAEVTRLISIKGVKHGKLVMTTQGEQV